MRRVGIFPTFGSVPTVLTFRHRARFANSRSSNPRQEHGCSLTVSESRHSGASSGLWSGPSVVYLSNPADVDLWSPVVDPVDLQSLQKPVWSVCVWSPRSPKLRVTVASEPGRIGVFLTRSCVHVTDISCGVVYEATLASLVLFRSYCYVVLIDLWTWQRVLSLYSEIEQTN